MMRTGPDACQSSPIGSSLMVGALGFGGESSETSTGLLAEHEVDAAIARPARLVGARRVELAARRRVRSSPCPCPSIARSRRRRRRASCRGRSCTRVSPRGSAWPMSFSVRPLKRPAREALGDLLERARVFGLARCAESNAKCALGASMPHALKMASSMLIELAVGEFGFSSALASAVFGAVVVGALRWRTVPGLGWRRRTAGPAETSGGDESSSGGRGREDRGKRKSRCGVIHGPSFGAVTSRRWCRCAIGTAT